MLSAVENFGPVGPSAALPYATQHSNTYAITAAAAAASAALLTPTHLTHLNALQTQYSEHQQQQQHQHQFQHQQQKELNQRLQYGLFLTPPPITSVASYSSAAAAASKSLTSKCSPQYNELSHLQQHIKLQQKSSLPYSHRPAREITPPNQSNPLNLPEESKSIMSINEFTRPHPKHQRHHNAAIRINSIPPQQQNNLSLNLNGYHNPTNYSTNASSNDQSGPMNLVTTSSAYANIHDNSRSSSSSSSVDIENDGSMSPVHSIPIQNRKQSDSTLGHSKLPHDPNDHSQQQNSAAIAATVAAASYQFNYTHLYASTAALYGAPVIFSSNHPAMVSSHGSGMRTHAPYLNGLSTHHPTQPQSNNAIAYSAAYLKAIQNAAVAAGLPFNTAAQQQTPPALSSPSASSGNHCRPTMHHNHTGSMLALAPPPPGPAIVSNNHTSSLSSSNDLRHKSQSELKKENNRICQPALPPPNTKLSTSGTYLNDKVNAESTDADNFFKVPSGKEGSLKHRILTRPSSSDKSEAIRNSAVMRTHNSTSNFRKGSYIELSNGNVRRVEDMRTEDFIQCAERSPHHQLTESTVVKISTAPPYTMVITFSYDKNRSKADIEVSAEHPFFVYGQGWASCNPEASLKAFGLKCQYLQVGDICISLTQRESKITHLTEAESNPSATLNQTNPSSHDDNQVSQNLIRQPLSEKRLAPVAITQYPVVHNIPLHMLPSHLSTNYSYANIAETVAAYNTQRDLALSPKVLSNFYQQPPQQHLFHPAAIHQGDGTTHELKNPNPQPLHLPRPSSIHSVQQRYYELSLLPTEVDQSRNRNDNNSNSIDVKSVASDEQDHDQDQDQPVDASTNSRKRRWSAPESICDESECQPTVVRQPHMSDGQATSRLSSYKTFVTSSSGSNDNLSI